MDESDQGLVMLGRRRAYEVHQFAIRHLQILGPMAQHLSSIIQICVACPAVIMKLITKIDRDGGEHPTLPVCKRSEEHTSELKSLMRFSTAVICLKTKIKLMTIL